MLNKWVSHKILQYRCDNFTENCIGYSCTCVGQQIKHITLRVTLAINVTMLQENKGNNDMVNYTTTLMASVKDDVYEYCYEAASLFVGDAEAVDLTLWIVLGVSIGILILIIIMLVLWKVGFTFYKLKISYMIWRINQRAEHYLL